MITELIGYFGKRNLIIATAVAIVLASGLMFAPAFAVSYNSDGTEVNSWDNTWNETHQAYLAKEAHDSSNNNSSSRSSFHNNSYAYNNLNLSHNSYSNSSVTYRRDGTEVNSWDNSWNETHPGYTGYQPRSNRENYRAYSTSYDTYYRDNAYNNRADDADYTQNARYAYDYDNYDYYTTYDFSDPYTLLYNDDYDDSYDEYDSYGYSSDYNSDYYYDDYNEYY